MVGPHHFHEALSPAAAARCSAYPPVAAGPFAGTVACADPIRASPAASTCDQKRLSLALFGRTVSPATRSASIFDHLLLDLQVRKIPHVYAFLCLTRALSVSSVRLAAPILPRDDFGKPASRPGGRRPVARPFVKGYSNPLDRTEVGGSFVALLYVSQGRLWPTEYAAL